MGGGKGSAPAAPDYTPIAQSDIQAAQIDAQTSANQLAFAQQQYQQEQPYVQNYMTAMTNQMGVDTAQQQQEIAVQNANIQNAQQQQQFYQQTYQPIESQFAQQATQYASPQRAQAQSAMAQADVANAYAGQRQAALQGLESYGIDPSQTRYGALDLGTRISQAGAQAGAGTQSYLNTLGTGLGLESEAINIGRGYPGTVAQTYATAQNAAGGALGAGQGVQGAGAAGIGAGTNTATAFGNLMGTPAQWGALQTGALGGATNAMNTGFQNQLSSFATNAQIAQNESSGIGSLIGGIGMASILAV
jgi:hypothetical protein